MNYCRVVTDKSPRSFNTQFKWSISEVKKRLRKILESFWKRSNQLVPDILRLMRSFVNFLLMLNHKPKLCVVVVESRIGLLSGLFSHAYLGLNRPARPNSVWWYMGKFHSSLSQANQEAQIREHSAVTNKRFRRTLIHTFSSRKLLIGWLIYSPVKARRRNHPGMSCDPHQ